MVKYVDNMKIPDFYFKTAGSWHQYHSDNKSTTDGEFVTRCQLTVRYLTGRPLAILMLARRPKSQSTWCWSGTQLCKRPSSTLIMSQTPRVILCLTRRLSTTCVDCSNLTLSSDLMATGFLGDLFHSIVQLCSLQASLAYVF